MADGLLWLCEEDWSWVSELGSLSWLLGYGWFARKLKVDWSLGTAKSLTGSGASGVVSVMVWVDV